MIRPESTPRTAAQDNARRAMMEAVSPSNALHKGVEYLQQNQLVRARQCFEQAMLANPQDAVARNCLGIVARSERRLTEALALFHKAIELQPEFAEAHNNMGNAYRDAENIEQAAECYRRALSIKPEFAEGHNNFGVAMLALGDVQTAVHSFEEAILLQPAYAEAHNNLANAYRQNGDLIGSAASFATALQLKPNSAEIHNNLANVLRETGQLTAALQHYEQSIQLRPDLVEAHENLGTVLLDLGKVDEAVAAFERAAPLQPSSVAALLNLGNAYRLAGRVEDARAMYRRAEFIQPEQFWHRVRIESLCPPAFRSRSEMELERDRALDAWQSLASERNKRERIPLDSRLAEPSFAWQFLHGDLRPLKEAFAEIFADGWPTSRLRHSEGPPRIGIVVTNGHEGIFLRSLAGVLQRLSERHFKIVVVCPISSESAIRNCIRTDLECLPIPLDFHQAVEAIRAAQFSALYFWEIGTDATNYFLPLMHLAPIQCTSWGVQVTSGMKLVDYYLGSELVESPNGAEHYTEQLLLAPTFLTYQVPPRLPAKPKTREDFGFTQDQHLYICAQQLGKFHPDFDDLIVAILKNDECGYFVSVEDRCRTATEIIKTRLTATAGDLADRIVVFPRLDFETYLQLLNVADVLLDPPHFGGVNSTYDGLAMSQPIVTLPTQYHRGRYTAACLRKIGLSVMIAKDADDYVRLATTLAADREQLFALRQQINMRKELLFRDDQAVRDHERLFEFLIQSSTRK